MSENGQNSKEYQQDLISDITRENVSPEDNIIESSVDPEQDVLDALANSEKLLSSTENLDEKDGSNSISPETDKTFEISEESENYSPKPKDADLDLNENEKCESETSEIIFSDNLWDDSEITEKKSHEDENTRDSLTSVSPQEEVSIFITQDVSKEEEGTIEDIVPQQDTTKEEKSATEIHTQDTLKEEGVVTEIMPEKREDEVVSPSLRRANLRFRWAKTLPAISNDVIFFSSHKRVSILFINITNIFYDSHPQGHSLFPVS